MEHRGTFSNTILEIFTDPGTVTVDLRTRIDGETGRQLRKLFGGSFAIITAYNPHGEIRTPAENQRRAALLDQRVSSLKVSSWRADGRSPDFRHQECGWAIPLSHEEAQKLGRDFEQLAFFWFDDEDFWLVSLEGEGFAERLPIGLQR
ncbi:MAG: DUF3293 domain-containing protein [Gemmatimonadota bacterium]|nr:DUF3293 domain-containing protein [Gemmatimonadota bacterium]